MEVTKYWISHMRDFYVPVLVLLCLHCAKTTVHLCQLNAGSYVFLKWSENDMIWTYAQPIFECFILPLYALKQTCPMLQSVKHIVTYGKFTMTVQSQPPANISLEVRTCHLSKSWSLVHNFMFLCHNCRSTQTLYAYKIWRNIGLMHREMARGLSKNSWTNLKLGRKTRAIHTHTHTYLTLITEKNQIFNCCLGWLWAVCGGNYKSVYSVKSARRRTFPSEIARKKIWQRNNTWLVVVKC